MTWLVVATLVAAAWTDVRYRRIPNALTIGALVAALVLRGIDGTDALLAGISGAGLAFAVGLPFFLLGALGGGDAKLLITVGAFMGPGRLVGALLVIALLGGLIAVVEALRHGVLLPAVLNTMDTLKHIGTLGRGGQRRTLGSAGVLTIPYGVAIAAGALICWFWGVGL